MAAIYQHDYAALSVYGQVVSLLREQEPTAGIHLDIGCGYGVIAEPVRDEVGRDYVGIDAADDGLESLRERGFEAHRLDLLDVRGTEAAIRTILGDRRIASLTLTDVLEHLTNGSEIVAMLRRLVGDADVPFVISVPNVSHKDIAFKLLLGRWDVTEAGLLDHTHVDFYTAARLDAMMRREGWHETAHRDWRLERSDQWFPADAPVLDHASPVGHFLRRLIDRANPHPIVNQFVRLYRPAEPESLPVFAAPSETSGPLLSVLIPSDRACADAVRSRLEDLQAQTCRDFEALLICAEAPANETSAMLAGLGGPVSVIQSCGKDLAEALNAGLKQATGRYVSVLRAQDRVGPDWAAAFSDLAYRAGGAVLRAERHEEAPTPTGDLPLELAALLEGYKVGVAPSSANFAVPRAAATHLGLAFEGAWGEAADHGLVVETALLCGVVRSQSVTVGSRPVSDGADAPHISEDDDLRALTRLNAHPLLLPPGSAEGLRRLVQQRDWFEGEHHGLIQARDWFEDKHHELVEAREWLGRQNQALVEALDVARPVAAFVDSFRHLAAIAARFRSRARPPEPDEGGERPFLSIITRTQGARTRTLRDVLMTLAGQTCMSFEQLIVVHGDDAAAVRATEALVAEFPASLRSRVRVLQCRRPGRSSPINDAWDLARGEYVSVLDDDDLVFSHYVETFRDLAAERPGSVLRSVSTRQDYEFSAQPAGGPRPRATSWFKNDWPSIYDPVRHMFENQTPFMSVAYPRERANLLGLRFDEKLSTVEDWDFTTQLMMLCGMHASPEVTSIYRWWTNGESSSFLYQREEWQANHAYVIDKLNAHPLVLPPGSAHIVADLYRDRNNLRWEAERVLRFSDEQAQEIARLSAVETALEGERDAARADLRSAEDNLAAQLTRALVVQRGNARRARAYDRKLRRLRPWPMRKEVRDRTRLKIDVLETGLFDHDWYLDRYPDVRGAGFDPLDHFVRHGMGEGRDPGPLFDSAAYRRINPDVAQADEPAFLHYLRFGVIENRRYDIASLATKSL